MNFRVRNYIELIESRFEGINYWRSGNSLKMRAREIFINLKSHETAKKVLNFIKIDLIRHAQVKVRYLKFSLDPLQLISPFIHLLSGLEVPYPNSDPKINNKKASLVKDKLLEPKTEESTFYY